MVATTPEHRAAELLRSLNDMMHTCASKGWNVAESFKVFGDAVVQCAISLTFMTSALKGFFLWCVEEADNWMMI